MGNEGGVYIELGGSSVPQLVHKDADPRRCFQLDMANGAVYRDSPSYMVDGYRPPE